MDTSIRIKRIIDQISNLDYDSKIQIVEKILSMIKSKTNSRQPTVKITDLRGLDAGIWKNVDIDKYVNNERLWD